MNAKQGDAYGALDYAGEKAIAACVAQGMALVDKQYGLSHERVDEACRFEVRYAFAISRVMIGLPAKGHCVRLPERRRIRRSRP